jgi:hypothetical protein
MIKRTIPAFSARPNTIGALSETDVLFVSEFQGKRVLRSLLVPPDLDEPGKLLDFFWQTALNSIWILPGTPLSRLASAAWFERASPHWVVVVRTSPHEPARPGCVVCWPRGSSQWGDARRLIFVFPEHAGWNWALADARSLLATVTYLEQVLKRPLDEGPELSAHRLLTESTRDLPPAELRVPSAEAHLVSRQDGTPVPLLEQAPDLAWMRPLSLIEQRQRYLHKYTHLSWSLAACLRVHLGGGAPEYSANGRAYDGMRSGIWRIQAERGGSLFDGKQLPSPREHEWLSTPQVKCCQDLGYQITVQEGYWWSQAHEILQPWAQRLWQAATRVSTDPQHFRHAQSRENSLRTITDLAHLGLTILAGKEHPDGWRRRDWWAQIVGRGRALLFAHLASLARKGTMPVLLTRNAIWVVSDNPNPLLAIPGLLTARRWKGYRVGYEVPLPLSREVQAMFRTTQDPDQVARALDMLAGEDFLA